MSEDSEYDNQYFVGEDANRTLVVGYNKISKFNDDNEIYIGIRNNKNSIEEPITLHAGAARALRDHLSTLLGDEPVEEETSIQKFSRQVSELYDALLEEGFNDTFAANFVQKMFQGTGGKS